jgi:hypothetical protein
MTNEYESDYPRPPALPTKVDRRQATTKPPDDSIAGQMSELAATLRAACEQMVKLETSLLQAKIAIVTEEHQVHRAHERIDELAKRVAALEPPELAAE